MPPTARKTKDPRVTKRKVTMRSVVIDPGWNPDENGGSIKTITAQAVDYVRPDVLEAYVAAARANWQSVIVDDVPDAGPGGYDGPTYVPPGIQHHLAGSYYPATDCTNCKHAPAGARVILEG